MKNSLISDLNKSLRLGIESDVTPNAENVDADDFVRECDTVSAHSIENTEEAAATNDVIEETEDQMDSAEAVEDLVSAVESASVSGKPLSRIEAAALTVTFAQITRKHYKDPLSLLPARESNQAYAMADLNLARESMKETAQDLYKKVVEAVKVIFQKIKEFIQKFLNKYKFLSNRFSKIIKEVNNHDLAKSDFEDAKVPVSFDRFVYEGKVNRYIIFKTILTIKSLEGLTFLIPNVGEIDWRFATEDDSTHRDLFQRISNTLKAKLSTLGDVVLNDGKVPAEVIEYVTLAGNRFVGLTKIGDSALCSYSIGNLDTKKENEEIIDENGKSVKDGEFTRKTMVEMSKVKDIKEYCLHCLEILKNLFYNSSKKARDLSAESNLKAFKATVNSEETLDGSEKQQAKLLIKYVSAESKFLKDMSLYSYDTLTAVAEYFEACLSYKDIDGEAKEVENPKEEAGA